MEPSEERSIQLLGQIATAVRSAARSAIRTPGWATALRLPPGFYLGSEIHEDVLIGCMPIRPTELGELVMLDLNLGDFVPVSSRLFDLLAMELEPFVVGVGRVRAEYRTEGRVILFQDERVGEDDCHRVTPEMVEAGLDAYREWEPRDWDAADLVCDVYKAMLRARMQELVIPADSPPMNQ